MPAGCKTAVLEAQTGGGPDRGRLQGLEAQTRDCPGGSRQAVTKTLPHRLLEARGDARHADTKAFLKPVAIPEFASTKAFGGLLPFARSRARVRPHFGLLFASELCFIACFQ